MINSLRSIFYDLIYGIKNIVLWLPTIWKDRNWDHAYVYYLLYKKIELMEKHNAPCDQYIGQENSLEEIREVKKILKRITEDKYLLNALQPVEEKYGEWHFEFEPIEGKAYGKMIDNRSDDHIQAWNNASMQANELEKQDKDKLFELLRVNLDKWWT